MAASSKYIAHIWNNCSSTSNAEDCVLNTSTATQNVYYGLWCYSVWIHFGFRYRTLNYYEYTVDPVDFFADYVDTGGHSTSAIEVRHKMKSKQSCWEQVGAGKVEEDFEICSKINQGIIDWAKNKL